MNVWDRIIDAINPAPRMKREAADYVARVVPPVRDGSTFATTERAVTIPAVYRALQVLTGAAAQMPIVAELNGRSRPELLPPILRNPAEGVSFSDLAEALVMSLAADGNAFLLIDYDAADAPIQLTALNPHMVQILQDPKTGRIRYGFNGVEYTGHRIKHMHLMKLPGALRGLGPIASARNALGGAIDFRDYMGNWFVNSGQPTGVLSSDQPLTAAEAGIYRNSWNGLDADGTPLDMAANPSGIKVLGKGLDYKPILLNPKDALWLEAQNFQTTDIARLFGIPAGLLLAAIEGNSMTYSNIEQTWLEFIRFTLSAYLRKIEQTLTEIAPGGRVIRFNYESLLRSDTKTRYDAHAVGIASGFLTLNEVRAIENLPPLPEGPEA